jgi:hypothetical protein
MYIKTNNTWMYLTMYIKLTKNEQNKNMCKDTEISKEYGKSLEASRGVSE